MALRPSDFIFVSEILPPQLVEKHTATVTVSGAISLNQTRTFSGTAINTNVKSPIVYTAYKVNRNESDFPSRTKKLANDILFGGNIYYGSTDFGYFIKPSVLVSNGKLVPQIVVSQNGNNGGTITSETITIHIWVLSPPN